MSKYVIRYKKDGTAKYISHLDFLRTIQRCIKRAEIPIKYTQGFNPHPIISFALPLSVGIVGMNELFEIELPEDIPADKVLKDLNNTMPGGICITEVKKVENNMFNEISKAEYIIYPESMPQTSQIESFLSQSEISMEKKTKKGMKTVSIREDIFEIEVCDNFMKVVLSAGDARNLSPMLLISSMNLYIDGYESGFCRYVRTKLMTAGKELI